MDLQLWWTGGKSREDFKRKIKPIELIGSDRGTDSDGVFWFGRKLRFLLQNFREGFQKRKNMEKLKLRKDGLIKIESEEKPY